MSNSDVELSLEVLEEKSLPSSLQVLRKLKGHLGRLGRRLGKEENGRKEKKENKTSTSNFCCGLL